MFVFLSTTHIFRGQYYESGDETPPGADFSKLFNFLGKTHIKKALFFSGRTTKRGGG